MSLTRFPLLCVEELAERAMPSAVHLGPWHPGPPAESRPFEAGPEPHGLRRFDGESQPRSPELRGRSAATPAAGSRAR